MTKRIELKPAKLSVTLERVLADGFEPDRVALRIFRDEQKALSADIYRGELLECNEGELSVAEEHQINAALVAEWLDWKPSDIGDSVPGETILDVFARLKKSLEDKGLIAGGEAAE